jgi:hypothetical protein
MRRGEIVQPGGNLEVWMEGYVLVIVNGGLIEEVAYSVHHSHAIGLAADIWPEMDPDTAFGGVFFASHEASRQSGSWP